MSYFKKELQHHIFSVAFLICIVLSVWMFRDNVLPEDWLDYTEPLDIERYVYLRLVEDYRHNTTEVMSGMATYQEVALTQKTREQIHKTILLFNPGFEKQAETEQYQYRPHIGYQKLCEALDSVQKMVRTEYDTGGRGGGGYSAYVHEMDEAYYWHESYCIEHYSPDQKVKKELVRNMAQDRLRLYDEFDDTIELKADQGIEEQFYEQSLRWQKLIYPYFVEMVTAEGYSRSTSRYFSSYLMVPLLFGIVLMSAFTFEADRRNHMEGFVYHSVIRSRTLVGARMLSVLCPVMVLLFGLVYALARYFNGIAGKMGYAVSAGDYAATALIDMLPGILFVSAVSFLVDLVFSNGVVTIVAGTVLLGILVLNPVREIDLWRVFYIYPYMNMTGQFREHKEVFAFNRILITGLSGVCFAGTGFLFERLRSGKGLFLKAGGEAVQAGIRNHFGKKNAGAFAAKLLQSFRCAESIRGHSQNIFYRSRTAYCVRDCINMPVIIGLILVPVSVFFIFIFRGSYGNQNAYLDGFSLFMPLSAVFLYTGISDTNIEYGCGMHEFTFMQKKSDIISYLIRFLLVSVILAAGCGAGMLLFKLTGQMQAVSGTGLIRAYLFGLAVTFMVGDWCAVISALVRSVQTDLLLGIGIFFEYFRLWQYIHRKDFSADGRLFELWTERYFIPAAAIGICVLFGVMIYKKYGKMRMN